MVTDTLICGYFLCDLLHEVMVKGSSALVIHGMEKETSLKNLSAVTSLTAAYGAEIGSGSCPRVVSS